MDQSDIVQNSWKVVRIARKTYELYHENGFIARIIYPKLSRYNASIEMADGETYSFRRKSYWRNTHVFFNREKEIGLLKITWGGSIRFSLTWENLAREYIFKRINFWKSGFVLTDATGNQLFKVRQHFKWKEFAYQYDVQSAAGLSEELDKLLFVLSVYFTNFLLEQSASEAAAAAT